MPELVLGPMLRYVSTHEATVWVQTSAACEVEILGHRARTFCAGSHHFALVVVSGLEPGSSTEYEVRLDGERHWPKAESEFPPSRIRTLPADGPMTIAWGSCRVTAPHEPPYTLDADEDERGIGVDALYVLSQRLQARDPSHWPQMLLMLGDQIYADEVSPRTKEYISARRDLDQAPGPEVLDVDEYTMLYLEAWSEPTLRWLHSVLPTVMLFDDHDVHDDWNTSESWIADMRQTSWWGERIIAGLWTYWIYQHLGNLSPVELEADELYRQVREAEDAGPLLRQFATAAEREGGGGLWSFSRQIGGSRLLVLDGREGRVLSDGQREMMDDDQWAWVTEQLTGDYDHVLLANTLPVLLAPTLHYVEAWNEAVCQGAWGRWAIGWSEKLRRALDLEHWASFQPSFHRFISLVADVGSGRLGAAPASVVMLGGDVHQAYLEHVGFRSDRGVRSAVYQAVCSPFRNQLERKQRNFVGIARRSRVVGLLARAVARSAGVDDPDVRWRVEQQPTWRNQLGWLEIDGRRLAITIETTPADHRPALEVSLHKQIS
ncbi:MAG TPA: alkaline phosphatase D family protein [Solirubrobacteraceae bacterium]|nr:alkaline phosphatase D family protein [Solirubrobacteraceae bacterium]